MEPADDKGTVNDGSPTCQIEGRKRNLIFLFPLARGEKEMGILFPKFKRRKSK